MRLCKCWLQLPGERNQECELDPRYSNSALFEFIVVKVRFLPDYVMNTCFRNFSLWYATVTNFSRLLEDFSKCTHIFVPSKLAVANLLSSVSYWSLSPRLTYIILKTLPASITHFEKIPKFLLNVCRMDYVSWIELLDEKHITLFWR